MALAGETAALLDDLAAYFSRYVVVTAEQADALALWTLHTYIVQTFSTTPYLIVTSAEKRSGKTRLIETLTPVAHNAIPLTAPTEAVLYRIAASGPTLLIDETDALFNGIKGQLSERQEALRGILNAGYRKGMKVWRCAPGSNEPEGWNVYGPKVLAGIGRLPTTLEDRGLCIRLSRRLSSEPVERFRYQTGELWGEQFRPRIQGWAPAARLALGSVIPLMPDELDDRAQDAYEALVAVADLAGDSWGERGRLALVALRNADSEAKESLGVRLFRDLYAFEGRLRMERIATHDLLAWLYEYGDEPWEEWWGESSGKKAARRLALTLAEYDVRPIRWKAAGESNRGYEIASLTAAMRRYGINTTPNDADGDLQEFSGVQHDTGEGGGVVLGEGANPHGYREASFGVVLDAPTEGATPISDPKRGSAEWFGTASWEELREYEKQLGLDTDDPSATLDP